jgi:hypothetical protein
VDSKSRLAHEPLEELAVDAETPSGAEDLESLAWACAWTGDLDLRIASWERAHAGWLEHGRADRAAAAAVWIARWHV